MWWVNSTAQSVLGPQEILEIESDEEEGTTITHISRAKDSEALNMFVKFWEGNKHKDIAKVMNLQILYDNFCQSRGQYK